MASLWLPQAPRDRLTPANAAAYVGPLKAYMEPALEKMIDDPDRWDPVATPWYSKPWMAEGDAGDATSGREAILGSFSGQVIQGSSFDPKAAALAFCPVLFADLVADMQNHTVIHYDPVAAQMLRRALRRRGDRGEGGGGHRDGGAMAGREERGGVDGVPPGLRHAVQPEPEARPGHDTAARGAVRCNRQG